MIDFCGIYSESKISAEYNNLHCAEHDHKFKLLYLDKESGCSDSFIFEDTNKIILFDGVILNAEELIRQSGDESLKMLIIRIPENREIIKKFRGSFAVVIYNKSSNRIDLLVDHLGKKRIFFYYHKAKKILIFGNKFYLLSSIMQQNNIDVKLDMTSAYSLLYIGYMISNRTLIEGLTKLNNGSILSFKNNIDINQYYSLDNVTENKLNKNDTLVEIDRLFNQSIEYEYQKDKICNKNHLVTLSGGLDSRMNFMTAIRQGFEDITILCFSEKNYLDEKIARQIAGIYEKRMIFNSLNEGKYLYDIESNIMNNNGLVNYIGSAHTLDTIKRINFSNFGLLHSGQLGDALWGTYLNGTQRQCLDKTNVISYLCNSDIPDDIENLLSKEVDDFADIEQLKFTTRGLNGMFNGYWQTEQYTEMVSPFLSIDFVELLMSIDPEWRYNNRLYFSWIKRFVPEAMHYGWERNLGLKPDVNKLQAKYIYLRKKIFRRIHGHNPSMNPFKKWKERNRNILKLYNHIFYNNIELIKDKKDKQILANLFNTDDLQQKAKVITLLESMRIFNIHQ